jgi:hypothetical protein
MQGGLHKQLRLAKHEHWLKPYHYHFNEGAELRSLRFGVCARGADRQLAKAVLDMEQGQYYA